MSEQTVLKRISITKATNTFGGVASEVHYTGKPIVVTKWGDDWVMIAPVDPKLCIEECKKVLANDNDE